MIIGEMASTRKKATRKSKRKMIDQHLVTITTNASLSAIEYDNNNGIQTIQNTNTKHQRDRHTNEQVSCHNKTMSLSNMINNSSDKQRTIEMINHNDTGNMRHNKLVIECVNEGITTT